jgi:hypothetical protein
VRYQYFSREKKTLLLAMKELGIKTGLVLTLDEKRVPHLW